MLKLLIGLVVFVLVLLIAGVVLAANWLESPELVETRHTWGNVTRDSTEVVTEVVVDNPNRLGFSSRNVSVEVDIHGNDVLLGEGERQGINLPEGRSSRQLVTEIDNNQVPLWWESHIANQEMSTIEIAMTGVVSAMGRQVRVPAPDYTRTLRTDLLDEANSNRPEVFEVGGYEVTVKERMFTWGEVGSEATEITGTVLVNNGTPVPIPVPEIDFMMVMNGVSLANGTTDNQLVMPPGEDTEVPVRILIEHSALLDWWPTHIRSGERTEYEITAEAEVSVSLPDPVGNQTLLIPFLEYSDQLATDILRELNDG
ncbi:MAG: LEA type 2 family protein [Dehalococcoidia bacterium]